ncbi:MAG: 3-isopropylmalate dehydratase large subunit [Candidatus Omnitrophica bacterium]|nr:3-isopropylmalate dehydratase large subunit [Candidatus Omnitrophota bacterium]
MGHTITEKILLAHTDKDAITPGEFILARVDIALANDVTAPIAIDGFKKIGAREVFDKDKIALVPDHFAPNKDIKSAEQCKIMRDFAHAQDITHFFEVGAMGIEHALLPEQGIVVPGDLVIGADSHTCTYGALGAFSTGVGSTDLAAAMATGLVWLKVPESIDFTLNGTLQKWVCGKDVILFIIGQIGVDGALYKAMEFSGSVIENLGIDDRLTICNMAIEAGGKSGIINPDEVTEAYVKERLPEGKEYTLYTSDDDAMYSEKYEFDLSALDPQVSFPHLPENTHSVTEAADVKVDQVVIGSCTNGRITDLRVAAEIFKGKKVAKGVRTIIFPATQQIYKQALKEGLFEIFVDAGCAVSTPTCGPCLGGHMGILAKGERAIASTNRNFIGRMGHPESEVYLASPAVCAASAVKGSIVHPEEIVR